MRRASTHRGIFEQPAGSNFDERPNDDDGRWGIKRAQRAAADGASWLDRTPWCGTWCRFLAAAGKVEHLSSRWASVMLIEDDARAGRGAFRDWRAPSEWKRVLRGDLVILFGRGVHVEMVRGFKLKNGIRYVITEGGNTSGQGESGSQSNGGKSARRERPLSDVHGFARVDYPGGTARRAVDFIATRSVRRFGPDSVTASRVGGSSDALLLRALDENPTSAHGAVALRSALKRAA